MDVPGPQGAALQIAKLVEQEERVIAGAAEVPVVGAAFLCAVSRAFARIHIEHDDPRLTPLVHRVDPLARQISEGGEVHRPIGAPPPTTQRIAGSRHNRSASFTSS